MLKEKLTLKNILKFCVIAEITTALALVVIPSVIAYLLFKMNLNDIGIIITRFAGICLLSLGIACWPKQDYLHSAWAMFIYNFLVAIFFIYIALNITFKGILLWPVAVLHFGLGLLLIRGLLVKNNNG